MLDYKKKMIIEELKNSSEEDVKDFLEALKLNEYFLDIYFKDINEKSNEYLNNVKSETIYFMPRG